MARWLVGLIRRAAPVLAVALVLGGCQSAPEEAPSWPEPARDRPAVDLTFTVAEDLTSVTGREEVTFTPDARVCELVFRAWPNKPVTAQQGNSLTVTAAWVEGEPVTRQVRDGGAGPGVPGTIVVLPLRECVDAGEDVDAVLIFEVELGAGTDERVGVSTGGDVAWFGSAFPLLAWVRDEGWAVEPAQEVAGEMATSETFDLRSLEVVAPQGMAVLGVGEPQGVEAQEGTTVHRFTAPAVRDVTVTVGHLDVLEQERDGLRVFVGTPRGRHRATAEEWAGAVFASAERLSEHFGPMPYTELWVSVLPDQTDGIEFPGAVQFGDLDLQEDAWLVTHEIAHMWFYGLVGNNQARDPWLDEALASFAQRLADEQIDAGLPDGREAVGRPMAYWARLGSRAYIDNVYITGADALARARAYSGPEEFDAALRQYLHDNAHAVAAPADLRAALADLPEAVAALARAGAFPRRA